MVGRGSDLYQLCKDIDDTIKGTLLKQSCMCTRLFSFVKGCVEAVFLSMNV